MFKCFFLLHVMIFFFSRPRVVSRVRGTGARRELIHTPQVLVLVFKCSSVVECSSARALVLELELVPVLVLVLVRAFVLECSCSSACAAYIGRSKPHKFSFFGFLLLAPSAAVK